jgi:hypothetical protein
MYLLSLLFFLWDIAVIASIKLIIVTTLAPRLELLASSALKNVTRIAIATPFSSTP